MKATGGQVLDAEAWEDFLQLLAAAAGKPVAWLEGLTEAQFEELFCLVIGIDRDLWKESEGPASGEEMTWAEILQSLVEHGHAFESTQRYTVTRPAPPVAGVPPRTGSPRPGHPGGGLRHGRWQKRAEGREGVAPWLARMF